MRPTNLLATLGLFLTLVPRVTAQCLTGDGLDGGPSCSSAFTQVPQPKFSQPALGICWQDCGVLATANYRAQWGMANPLQVNTAGTPPSCGWYSTTLRLYQGSILRWSGAMHMTYSRTWLESGTSGGVYQVWRYLVNGDLRYVTANPGPCAIPPCANPNLNRTRFTGYIDYALDCSVPGGLLEHAWMITHGCDATEHVAGFPRAGTYHPNRFYTFLGPRAGFVVGAGGTLENGAVATESVRKLDALVLPARCDHEEPLLFGSFNPSANVCLCGTGPGLWYEAFFTGAGGNGTTLNPFLGSDPFRSFPIGMWTNPNAYPGVEEVRWNTNELQYVECTGVGRNEYYYGVTTSGGFPAFTISSLFPTPPPMPLPQTFVDQSNSVLLPANVATRNIPFKSDHILNLNL